MKLDKELLKRNLEEIQEPDVEMQENRELLRRLLLVLAGDQRVISELSLEDLEELFSVSTSLLWNFQEKPDNYFNESKLVNYAAACRRAV